uniref:Integrase, catalytic region, zinc finger, CCHC-type, peptidase aspartic, catalytic n=1 Tax=Tanacetum cinerariifolium TaxID=118510 RepID=A0A6L2LBI0_TANCI|nr:integrase, catalytic region, zinc finger, CCHC-type, peptidase aspartic, catalytic [Tanacetum cinerariifolium]
MIIAGADNRPPILEKSLKKTYAELSASEKLQADCDNKAANIVIQGLPSDVMDNLNITMVEYIRLKEEKARQLGKVYNWETAKYGKIWYDEDVHDLRSVETEFPALVFNDELSSEKHSFVNPRDWTGYTIKRDPMLRLYHRLITCSIAGRSQAPEKVTVADLFYLKGMDVGSVNIPYLLARYLRLFSSRRKHGAMISEERQHVAVAGTPKTIEDAPVADEGAPAVPAPVQAPQPPHPAAGLVRTMAQTLAQVEENVHEIRGTLGEQREVVQIILWYLESGCSKHMTGNRSQLMNFVSRFLGIVRFENDQIAKIMSSRLGLKLVTPPTSCSGLVPNTIPQKPCNPPNRDDWDNLFQPMFNVYFNPSTIAVSPVLVAAEPRTVNIAESPVSTLEEEKAHQHGKVYNWETAKYGKIWYDEDVHDLKSVETEFPALVFNDELSSKKHSFVNPRFFDDLDFFKDFENEFLAIVYNDALTSKSDFLTKPTLKPQHIDEFNLKDETSLSEYDEVEQNVLYFNDLFPFNLIYPDDLTSDKDNYYKDGVYTRMLWRPRCVFFTLFKLGKLVSKNGHDVLDMALPPRDQRHRDLRFEGLQYIDTDFTDFEERLYDRESYNSIRDPMLRMCHRLIAYSIAGRSHAPEKVFEAIRFEEEARDIDIQGQFVACLAKHFRLLTKERLQGFTMIVRDLYVIDMAELVAMAGAPKTIKDAPVADKGALVILVPVQAPQPPYPAAKPARTMA